MSEFPLISLITPTYNRQEFLPRAIRCFLAYDYPALEWIILDDSTTPIGNLLPDDPRIKYTYQTTVYNHGTKSNLCCEKASGSIIIVHDDDDFYPADRVTRQVQPMLDNPAIQLTGTSTLYYYRKDIQQAWQYISPKSIGWLGAIAFRKPFWEQNKFEHIKAGADYNLQRKLHAESKHDLFDPRLVVASIHPTNACKKNVNQEYKPVSYEIINQLVGGDL